MIFNARTVGGVFVAALIATLITTPAQALQQPAETPNEANLLANAGFETGSTLESLSDWKPWSERSLAHFSVATDQVSEGTQSLHVKDTSATTGGGMVSSPMPVTANTTYEVNLDVHHVSGSFSVWVYFDDAAGAQLSSKWQTVRTTTGTWERSFLEFESPAGAAQARVMIYSGNAPQSDVFVDDLYFGLPGQSEHQPPPVLSVPEQVLAQDENLSYLGTPVGSRVVRNMVIAEENGVSMTYGVYKGVEETGTPATLVVARTADGEIVRTLPMKGADFAQQIRLSSDGKVYMATTGSYSLWVYDPATTQLREIGVINPATPAHGYAWSLAAAEDGKMYIGSYPKGYLYLYDPADDSISNLGAVDSSQAYIHALAYDFERRNLYVGVGGSSAQIWKVSADGTKKPLLNDENAPGVTDLSFVTTFTFVDDRLFARASSQLLVVGADDEVEYWRGEGGEIHGYHVSPRPDAPGKYIFTFGKSFWEYDSATATTRNLGIETNGYLNDSSWTQLDDPNWPGWTMIAATDDGVIRMNPQAGISEMHDIVYATPTTVQRIFNGPDSMYASGYMIGLASFDAETGRPGPSLQSGQYEAAEVRDGKLLLAAYGNARLMEYDPATGAAPRQIFSLQDQGQDRPRMDYDPASDRIFMGTVAHYGHNQGGLTVYDFATNTRKTFTTEIVEEQSVISVLAHDGLVYLGTTIDGGLGAPVSGQTDGHFIVWDPDAEQVVHDFIPVPGDEGVTGLMVGPDGLIWGVSENTVFKYDPDAGQIVYSEPILAHRYGSGTVWMWANLVVGADGNVYGTDRFSFFRIDPDTMEYTEIVPDPVMGAPIMNAVDGPQGDIYFSHGPFLFRYDVPEPAEAACTVQLDDRLDGELVVRAGEVACGVEVTVNGGVRVEAGGALRLSDSMIRGGITSDGAAFVRIQDTSVAGAVEVNGTTGAYVFAGNDVRGSVHCSGNTNAADDRGQPNAITGSSDGCEGL